MPVLDLSSDCEAEILTDGGKAELLETLKKESRDGSFVEQLKAIPNGGSLLYNSKVLLTWFLLFILLWKCDNNVSENALNALLSFLHSLFHMLGPFNSIIDSVAKLFPRSLYMLRQMLGIDRNDFQ